MLSAGFAILSLVALVVALSFRAADQRRIDHLTKSTNAALCTFKQDLRRRATDLQQFIKQHPEGFAGVSRTDLERSLESQEATLTSLSELDC